MTLPFKVESAVVCDSVRREENGKLLLIGVYGGSILLSEYPAAFALSLALRIRPIQLGAFDLEFRGRLDDDVIVKGDAKIEAKDNDVAFIIMEPLPMRIEHEGVLRFEMREKKKRKWALLSELQVGMRPTSPTA